jgi:hypothetical protein
MEPDAYGYNKQTMVLPLSVERATFFFLTSLSGHFHTSLTVSHDGAGGEC